MEESNYRAEQLQARLNEMSRTDLLRAISAIDDLAPDAVGRVLGLTSIAQLGAEAHAHQDELIADVRQQLADKHLGSADAYDMLDDFSELVSQDMRVAAGGEYAEGIGQILEIIQLFPWFADRTHNVIQPGMGGMWLDSVAENLAPLPDTEDAQKAKQLVARALADPQFAGMQKFLQQFQAKL